MHPGLGERRRNGGRKRERGQEKWLIPDIYVGGKVGVVTGLEIAAITLESQKRPTDQKINPPVDRMESNQRNRPMPWLSRVKPSTFSTFHAKPRGPFELSTKPPFWMAAAFLLVPLSGHRLSGKMLSCPPSCHGDSFDSTDFLIGCWGECARRNVETALVAFAVRFYRARERERERDEFRGVQDAGEFWEDRFLGSFCWLYELFLLRR